MLTNQYQSHHHHQSSPQVHQTELLHVPVPDLNVPVADVVVGGDARQAGGGHRGDSGVGAGWPDRVSLPGLAWHK